MKLRFCKDSVTIGWVMYLHIGAIEEWIDQCIISDEDRDNIIEEYKTECAKENIPLEVVIQ